MNDSNEQVKQQWEHRDRVSKAISEDGLFRAAIIHNSVVTRTAQQRHQLDPVRALLLARALTGASLIASFLKGEERVSLAIESNGQVKHIYAEALQLGEVRGYATMHANPVEAERPLGDGMLRVQRVLYGKREPVTGIVELRRGDVTSDLGYYLTQSEQIPSAVVVDVSFNKQDVIQHSVGLIVQALPGARPEDIFKVYDTIDYLDRLAGFVERRYTTEEMMQQIFPFPMTHLGSTAVDFFCRCSLDRFKSVLLTLGYDEVMSMRDEGQNELVCQYCNEKYYLTEQDFESLREQLLARRN